MELVFLLIAGFVVAPLAGRSRILGVLAGIPLIYVLNQARILALFYSNRNDPDLFDACLPKRFLSGSSSAYCPRSERKYMRSKITSRSAV